MKCCVVAACAVLLASCSTKNDGLEAVQDAPAAADCPVTEASDFAAWVNKMPGPDGAKLHVTGKLTFPTSGYDAKLKAGILDRRIPPKQRLILEVTPPNGPAAQVITTLEINTYFPAAYDRYRGIAIRCGSQTLVEITEVPLVY